MCGVPTRPATTLAMSQQAVVQLAVVVAATAVKVEVCRPLTTLAVLMVAVQQQPLYLPATRQSPLQRQVLAAAAVDRAACPLLVRQQSIATLPVPIRHQVLRLVVAIASRQTATTSSVVFGRRMKTAFSPCTASFQAGTLGEPHTST